MASHHQRQEAGHKGDDEMSTGSHAHQFSRPSETQQQHDQNASITSQATNFLQQTGEQVKNMAQGATMAVKNTLGMNTDDSSINPSAGSTGGPTASTGNHAGSVASFASGGNHPGGAGVSPDPTASVGSRASNPSPARF